MSRWLERGLFLTAVGITFTVMGIAVVAGTGVILATDMLRR